MMIVALAAVAALVALAMGGRGSSSSARPPAPTPRTPAVPPPAPDVNRGQTIVINPGPAPDTTTHDGGVVSPPDMGPRAVTQIDPQGLPAELLPLLREGGTASNQDLERGAALADELGYPDVADHLRARLQRRVVADRARRDEAPARDVPIPSQSFAPDALPLANADRNELRALALRVANNISGNARRQYDRALLTRFQRSAGILADGKYGRQSAQALGHYGQLTAGQVPPPQY